MHTTMSIIDRADLWKIGATPREASLDECCMAASISCGNIAAAYGYADRVAKNKGKYYQHLYYFLHKYS